MTLGDNRPMYADFSPIFFFPVFSLSSCVFFLSSFVFFLSSIVFFSVFICLFSGDSDGPRDGDEFVHQLPERSHLL